MAVLICLLMVLTPLAFNVVNSNEVITQVSCRSTNYCVIYRCYYTTRACPIPGVTTDTPVTISLKSDNSLGTCKQDQTYSLQKATKRPIYNIIVKNGCDGLFEVRKQVQVQEPSPTKTTKTIPNDPQCGLVNKFRIINGHRAYNCQYPWMVWIYNSHARMACGGSILDQSHILTAAHCVTKLGSPQIYPVSAFYLYSGSSRIPIKTYENNPTLRERNVSAIMVHDKFNHINLANDVAILKLVSKIKLDTCHRPVCMINGSHDVLKAKNCRVMGWGYTSDTAGAHVEEYLRWVGQKPASNTECAKEYHDLDVYQNKTFCASGIWNDGSDSCSGDSGGPFMCQEGDGRYYQFGLVSAGSATHKCGMGHGLYTKVESYLDWIADTLEKS